MESTTSKLSKKVKFKEYEWELRRKIEIMCGRLEILKKFKKMSKKKERAKISPKSKKWKHRKVLLNVY